MLLLFGFICFFSAEGLARDVIRHSVAGFLGMSGKALRFEELYVRCGAMFWKMVRSQ